MTQQFIDILIRMKPDILEYKGNNLVQDGIFDSFEIVKLVTELEEAFSIDFAASDITPENFASPKTIWTLVERLRT